MDIVVGSENGAKIKAAQIAVDAFFPGTMVRGIRVDSGVAAQPKSDDEAIRGAINRARRAVEATGADFGIGLEGGINQIGDKWFECGWAAVVHKDGRVGLGSSGRFEVSGKMLAGIVAGQELGAVIDSLTKRKDVSRSEGAMGVITNGHLPRAAAYAHGVLFALAPFISDRTFWE